MSLSNHLYLIGVYSRRCSFLYHIHLFYLHWSFWLAWILKHFWLSWIFQLVMDFPTCHGFSNLSWIFQLVMDFPTCHGFSNLSRIFQLVTDFPTSHGFWYLLQVLQTVKDSNYVFKIHIFLAKDVFQQLLHFIGC